MGEKPVTIGAIRREIRSISGMQASPFRKGIIAGLKARTGQTPVGNAYPANGPADGRAHRLWREGYEHGLVRRLPLPPAPGAEDE